jgi:hypothetical protein
MSVLRKLQKKSKEFPKTSLSDELPNGQNPVYNFGSFRLDQAERQLLHNGNPVHLAPKAFDLLLVLIQHKGCLVTKERLLREVWHDVYVEEANLSVNIASLRKALEESDAEGQWIESQSLVVKQSRRSLAASTSSTSRFIRSRCCSLKTKDVVRRESIFPPDLPRALRIVFHGLPICE